MTRFYRFLDIYEREVCVNPKYVIDVHQCDNIEYCMIEVVGGRAYELKADINIICDILEMIANNKI